MQSFSAATNLDALKLTQLPVTSQPYSLHSLTAKCAALICKYLSLSNSPFIEASPKSSTALLVATVSPADLQDQKPFRGTLN